MTHIKICGITTLDDALAATALGVHALGFNFWPQSPRYIAPAAAAAIIAELPDDAAKIGVFVDEARGSIIAIVRGAGLDTVQLHGTESPAFVASFDGLAFKALRLRDEGDLHQLRPYLTSSDSVFLLDTYNAALPGGTGEPGNWGAAAAARKLGRLILAGGLTAENVTHALDAVHPWAVDVCSGVEASPGKKDPEKMSAFVQAVEHWDHQTFKRLLSEDD